MSYSARILLDSISDQGARLTTMELTYPRFVHSEAMTHRKWSRNAASSRAIPVEKMLERVKMDPAMPVFWGANQKGMQASAELVGDDLVEAKWQWQLAMDDAVARAEKLLKLGLHKQIVNRILEPWCWITVIATATDWNNFFWLRCHADAQPEIRKVAALALREYHQSTPVLKHQGFVALPAYPTGRVVEGHRTGEADLGRPLRPDQLVQRSRISGDWRCAVCA